MKITGVVFNAGSSWNRLLYDYCTEKDIPFITDGRQNIDLGICLEDGGKSYSIAVELKYTDLHQSLVGKEIAGNLRWELKQHYLPQRAKKIYDDIWLFVTPYPDMRDGVILDSICAEHRIIKKSYFTQDAVVKGIFDFAQNWKKPIDLSMPEYINESDQIDQLSKMLRIFPGFTEEPILKVREYRDIFNLSPCDSMYGIYDILKDFNENLARLWFDWYNSGIEPKENKLKNGI